jgi:hypothetical protein
MQEVSNHTARVIDYSRQNRTSSVSSETFQSTSILAAISNGSLKFFYEDIVTCSGTGDAVRIVTLFYLRLH